MCRPAQNQFDAVAKMLGLDVPKDVANACRFLESQGLRFCVDFGVENAIEKASDIMTNQAVALMMMEPPDGGKWWVN